MAAEFSIQPGLPAVIHVALFALAPMCPLRVQTRIPSPSAPTSPHFTKIRARRPRLALVLVSVFDAMGEGCPATCARQCLFSALLEMLYVAAISRNGCPVSSAASISLLAGCMQTVQFLPIVVVPIFPSLGVHRHDTRPREMSQYHDRALRYVP